MIGEYFEEAFVEAGGFRMRYLAGGTGPPIIDLHRRGDLHHSPAHELLAQRFRVIAFEMPDVGTSPKNGRSAGIADLARTLNAAVAALGIERYSLMGSSVESTIALWMAILRPESVDAIVLSAPETLRAPADESLVKRAGELEHPVLVLFGTADTVSPPEDAHLYRELLQNCHIMLVYGAGHAIDADRPEAFASLAGDFLTRKEQFVVTETSALIHP